MGLDVYLYKNLILNPQTDDDYESGEEVRLNSVTRPDHIFKIGYFRSSYNASGIDRILRDRIGVTLGSIFGEQDEYHFVPDWKASRERAAAARDAYRAYVEKNGNYRVMEANSLGAGFANEADVLAWFHEERERDSPFGWYSNADGMVMLQNPPKVVAAVTGKNCLGSPCAYLVYEADDAHAQWVLDALSIVIETCDYVLSQPDPSIYAFKWSG